jgi:cytochrome c553
MYIMPRHIARFVVLLVVFAIVAYGAKKFFTVKSFYEYGHYRGDSVADIAADKPKYKGVAYCASCHVQQLTEWSNGVHNSTDIGKIVRCEVCHGAAGSRDERGMFEHSPTGPDHPKNLKLAVPADTRKLCTLCHERITGRPLQQAQIVVAEHAGSQQCVVCHNPHSPRLGLVSATPTAQTGDAAAGKVKAAACAGCHGAAGVSVNLPGPTLAGQHDAYLVDSFKAYSAGARDNPMMSAVAKGLSDEDAGNFAAYYSGLKCESTLTAEKQAALAGKVAASKCVACHGANGVSPNRSWPSLVGQSKDFLVNSLAAYKSGARKNSIMAGIAKSLNDADVEAVAAYYAGASCK